MVLILLAVFGVLAGNTGDSPVISLGKSATDFTLAVGGVTWLKSAPLRVFMDGTWSSPGSGLTEKATTTESGSGLLGEFTAVNTTWTSLTGVEVVTSVAYFASVGAVVFTHAIPAGAKSTNASNPTLPTGTSTELGSYPPVVAYPAFDGAASASALAELGYVTWQGCMVNVDYGKNPLKALKGLSSSGPVALFNNTDTTVVVSPLDNFKNAVHYFRNDQGMQAWETGVSSEVFELPSGFSHRTLLVTGSGITATMDKWGTTLRNIQGTNRQVQNSPVINSLSYWTDNGAYYYGDAWNEAGGGGAPCNETSMVAVADGLKADGILDAVKVWQLDDWWYPGPRKVWVHCVQNWTLSEPAFQHNLAWLHNRVDTPWLLYVPFFCPDSVYAKDWEFVLSVAGETQFAEPHPDHALEFYRMLFDYGVSQGMKEFENDFLNFNLLAIPYFRQTLGASAKWLNAISTAALERQVGVQMCMALPSDLMESTRLDAVTNYRASGDYAGSGNFNIGGSALLAFALDLRPSKDNFWTHRPESAIQTGKPWGSKSNPGSNCELNTIIATLSCGPLGIADKAGDTNVTLVKRAIREDGLTVQPDRPATIIDPLLAGSVLPANTAPSGKVWSTSVTLNSTVWQYALSIDTTTSWKLGRDTFYPVPSADQYVLRRWHHGDTPAPCNAGTDAVKSGCVENIPALFEDLPAIVNDRPIMVANDTHVYDLHMLAPVLPNDYVFLGDVTRYVSVSSKRFASVTASSTGLEVTVLGTAGESVVVVALKPPGLTVVSSLVKVPASGSVRVVL